MNVKSLLDSDVLAWLWPGFSWLWLHFFQAKAKPLGLGLALAWPGSSHGLGLKLGLSLALAWPWLRPWLGSKKVNISKKSKNQNFLLCKFIINSYVCSHLL